MFVFGMGPPLSLFRFVFPFFTTILLAIFLGSERWGLSRSDLLDFQVRFSLSGFSGYLESMGLRSPGYDAPRNTRDVSRSQSGVGLVRRSGSQSGRANCIGDG